MNPDAASNPRARSSPAQSLAAGEPGRNFRRSSAAGGLIHRPASILDLLDLDGLFASPLPVEVEVGSGDGSFLTQYAVAHPEVNFLGVERLLGRLRKIDRKGFRLGLTNLRLVRLEASYLLKFLLPGASIRALHIYFPDPWPKRKHRHHRLVNERFPEIAARLLLPGGRVYLRTDHVDYFGQMTRVFDQHPGFLSIATPDELSGCWTDFEKGFVAAGIQTRRLAYQLRNGYTSITGPPPS